MKDAKNKIKETLDSAIVFKQDYERPIVSAYGSITEKKGLCVQITLKQYSSSQDSSGHPRFCEVALGLD